MSVAVSPFPLTLLSPDPSFSGLRPHHGFLGMLWGAYAQHSPRRRHFRLLRHFAVRRRAIHTTLLADTYEQHLWPAIPAHCDPHRRPVERVRADQGLGVVSG